MRRLPLWQGLLLGIGVTAILAFMARLFYDRSMCLFYEINCSGIAIHSLIWQWTCGLFAVTIGILFVPTVLAYFMFPKFGKALDNLSRKRAPHAVFYYDAPESVAALKTKNQQTDR